MAWHGVGAEPLEAAVAGARIRSAQAWGPTQPAARVSQASKLHASAEVAEYWVAPAWMARWVSQGRQSARPEEPAVAQLAQRELRGSEEPGVAPQPVGLQLQQAEDGLAQASSAERLVVRFDTRGRPDKARDQTAWCAERLAPPLPAHEPWLEVPPA